MLPFADGGDMTDIIKKMKKSKNKPFKEEQILFWAI